MNHLIWFEGEVTLDHRRVGTGALPAQTQRE
jgi:hypothetical protein